MRHVPEGGKPTLLGQKGSERPAYDFDGMLCEDGPATGEGTEMSEFSYSFAVNLRFEGTMQGVSGKTLLGQLLQNTQDPGKAIAADRNPYSNSVIVAQSDQRYSKDGDTFYVSAATATTSTSRRRPPWALPPRFRATVTTSSTRRTSAA